ncbi:hypothetical protein ASPCADRAFT_210866 [Aspergillus carbonarius ITEM 5010]|uniref:Uncharacterized protein n=1 Tax=Aspergillus carbonarius (strain ITEM 5010) TaxID=602072 RepID=A0A1R3RAG4_ASPC5|nr:hypothetical protein ASPCADRAFT_210866 [Aspergillus carbonarius ITEM 5010]
MTLNSVPFMMLVGCCLLPDYLPSPRGMDRRGVGFISHGIPLHSMPEDFVTPTSYTTPLLGC